MPDNKATLPNFTNVFILQCIELYHIQIISDIRGQINFLIVFQLCIKLLCQLINFFLLTTEKCWFTFYHLI